MRRPVVVPAVLLLVGALVIPARAGDNIYFRDADDSRIEPKRVTLIAGAGALLRFRKLTPWRNWGDARAKGKGRYAYNTCQPDCASGNYDRTGVRVRVSQIGSCRSERRYQVFKYAPAPVHRTPG